MLILQICAILLFFIRSSEQSALKHDDLIIIQTGWFLESPKTRFPYSSSSGSLKKIDSKQKRKKLTSRKPLIPRRTEFTSGGGVLGQFNFRCFEVSCPKSPLVSAPHHSIMVEKILSRPLGEKKHI